MRDKLGAFVYLAALLALYSFGSALPAGAEERASFVQTATSGMTISGYVDTSMEWPVESTGLIWNGAEGSVENSDGTAIGPADGITIFSDMTVPTGMLDVQTVPEPSPLALGLLACALFVVSQSSKRGFRSC